VTSDSAAIAALAAAHLRERGLRHFGYCGDARFQWARRHGENFAAELRRSGFSCDTFPASRRDAADRQRERARLAEWLRALPKPVGVMACYDIRGQQILDVCRATGLRVPDEVAVIGQHNDELLCDLCDPPLSSVIPDARRIGFHAAKLLDGLMRGKRPRARAVPLHVAPLGVATRQSTDTLAVEDARLAKAMRFLREHAQEMIGVGDIARAAGMSRSLLERRFREVFDGPVWNHVLELRCRAAESLLRGTALGLAEIAERTGFGTAEHFSAVFRQRRGMPPSGVRRAAE
jgi:LacI family transcriptional regulator